MISTLFRSDDLPSADRFEQWCEVTARQLQPMRFSVRQPRDFRGSIRTMTLGPVQLTEIAHSSILCRRDPADVRRHDPQRLQLQLVLQGTMVMDVEGRQVTASAGQMLVHGSWHPYTGSALAPNGMARRLVLCVPKQGLAVPQRWISHMLGRRLHATGSSAILASLLTDTFSAADQGTELHPREAAQLGNAALSLVSAIIARDTGARAGLPPEARHHSLLRRIHAFIDAHLADPALSPQMVADAHHISLRHLHRLFHQNDISVSAWIRHRRLEHCRRDLVDATLADRPIHAIAARHGFPSAAEFSRAFRTVYGITPSDYRGTALTG